MALPLFLRPLLLTPSSPRCFCGMSAVVGRVSALLAEEDARGRGLVVDSSRKVAREEELAVERRKVRER